MDLISPCRQRARSRHGESRLSGVRIPSWSMKYCTGLEGTEASSLAHRGITPRSQCLCAYARGARLACRADPVERRHGATGRSGQRPELGRLRELKGSGERPYPLDMQSACKGLHSMCGLDEMGSVAHTHASGPPSKDLACQSGSRGDEGLTAMRVLQLRQSGGRLGDAWLSRALGGVACREACTYL